MDIERYWWLYGLIAIAALFGSLQLGINMGFNYAVDNAEGLGITSTKTKTVEVVKEVPVERIVYKEGAVQQVVREVQVSGNVTIPQKSTYSQVVAWLKKDGTNTMPYNADTFSCVDYASTVNNNAELDGLKCAVFYIKTNEVTAAHMGVVFDTSDKGLVYVEPQFDWILPELKVGMDYQQIITDTAKKYNTKYTPIGTSPIKKIVIIW
jgi:PKD repeat protein